MTPGFIAPSSAERVRPAAEADEVHLHALRPALRYLRDRRGGAIASRVAAAAGLDPEVLEVMEASAPMWIAGAAFEAALDAVLASVDGEAELREACGFGVGEDASSAPRDRIPATLRAHLAALQRGDVRYDLERSGEDWMRLRYATSHEETRIRCVARQAYVTALARAAGFPSVRVEETGCVARGDGACEYLVEPDTVGSAARVAPPAPAPALRLVRGGTTADELARGVRARARVVVGDAIRTSVVAARAARGPLEIDVALLHTVLDAVLASALRRGASTAIVELGGAGEGAPVVTIALPDVEVPAPEALFGSAPRRRRGAWTSERPPLLRRLEKAGVVVEAEVHDRGGATVWLWMPSSP